MYSDGIMHELYNLEKVRARTRCTYSVTGSSSQFIGGEIVEEKDHCSIILNSTDVVKLSYSMKLVNHIDDKKNIIETINSYEFKGSDGYGWILYQN